MPARLAALLLALVALCGCKRTSAERCQALSECEGCIAAGCTWISGRPQGGNCFADCLANASCIHQGNEAACPTDTSWAASSSEPAILLPADAGTRIRPPRVRGDTGVRGRLPLEAMQSVVRGNIGELRRCYVEGLRQEPKLEGRVTLRFVIGRDGVVSSVSTAGALAAPAVSKCIARAFYGLSFPKPEGGVVTPSCTLLLSTAGGAPVVKDEWPDASGTSQP